MLNRNVFRTLKKQYIPLLLLGLMITLSSFVYTVMDYGVAGIYEPTEAFFDQSNQEDFAISMVDLLLEDEILYVNTQYVISEPIYTLSGLEKINRNAFEDIIHARQNKILDIYPELTIELREYKDIFYSFQNDSHRMRVLKDSNLINRSYFVSGHAPEHHQEIALTEAYANLNNLNIGDFIQINQETYEISGFVLFPDYSLAMFSNDLIFDNKSQTIAMVTDQQFHLLDESVGFDWMGDSNDVYSEQTFKDEVIQTIHDHESLNFVTQVVLTKNNMRSGAIYGEIEGGKAIGLMLSLLIASIAILIVGIMISKILQSQRGPIGILKSMGYSNFQISIPYIFYLAVLSFPAILIGYFLGYLAAEPMKNLYLLFYLLPSQPIKQHMLTFLVSVGVPFVFILTVGYLVVHQILRKKPTTLLNPEVSRSANFVTKRISPLFKRFSIQTKLKHLLLYRSFVKFLIFIMGMFYAAFLIYLSLSMIGIFDRSVNLYYDHTEHNYVGYVDLSNPYVPLSEHEKAIELPSVLMNENDVYLVGIDASSTLHPLINKKDEDITYKLSDGIIISESLRLLNGYKVGEDITIDLAGQTYQSTIVGVSYEYSGKAYMNLETLSLFITSNQSSDYFNVIYSINALDKNDFLMVIHNQDIINQTEDMAKMMNTMTFILTGVSLSIGAIIIYILTVMTIEDNFYNISLFKVIGYNQKEINKMILGGYFIYGLIIFIVTIPISYGAFMLITQILANQYDLIMPFEIKIWHMILSVLMFVVIFYGGAWVSKRKLRDISLQEAMKMYQV
ncbi:MAG TPA: ABC transporter permease [Acholeplasmataceae bacterium]|nr:ABC transporter permease [Acholeplasmataceae bacterium]